MLALIKLLPFGAKIGAALAVLAAVFGILAFVHHKGYESGLNVSKVAIAKYQTEVIALDKKLHVAQDKVTTRVVTEYQTKVQTITKVETKNHDIIVNSVPHQFNLSNGWVTTYNFSIAGLTPTNAQASDKTISTVTDTGALDAINHNNGVALRNAQRLTSLQEWVREQERVNETVGHASTNDSGSVPDNTPTIGSGNTVSDTASSSNGSGGANGTNP